MRIIKILSLTTLASCRFKVIYMNQTMGNFKNLCNSEYGKVANEMSLQNLSVFFRNGDRAPEDGSNLAWNKRMCINCNGNKCSLSHCKNGMLTVKGYKQGHDLSAFIKQQYYAKFNNKKIETIDNKNRTRIFLDNFGVTQPYISEYSGNTNSHLVSSEHTDNYHGAIFSAEQAHVSDDQTPDIKVKGYYYPNNRSYGFLKSVVESLEYSSLNIHMIRSLNTKKSCLDLRNSLFQKLGNERLTTKGEFDKIISSLCTDVPVDCSKFECDLMKMEDYLVQTQQSLEDDISRMREDFLAIAIDFAPLSRFILDIIKSNGDINLVSVTGETIISLLAGLNTNNQELIPYGGAVFLELWKDKAGNEFYALRYNEKQMDFGLFKEKFIEKSQFIKFLEMFAVNEKKIEKICKHKTYRKNRSENIDISKQKLTKLLNPIMKKLHDKRILIK